MGPLLVSRERKGLFQVGLFNRDLSGINAQIGVVNICDNNPWIQIGLLNSSHFESKDEEEHFAVQIGLWNSNGEWSFPLFNVIW